MTIKVLEKTEGCMPEILPMGDWIDLRLAEDVHLRAPQANKMHIRTIGKNPSQELRTRDVDFSSYIASLGVCIEVPKGYECIVVPRSSTFKKYGVMETNSMGVIDNSYNSDEDIWKMPMVALRDTMIPKGTRIAQFRVQLSQKATFWQKLRWLFSSGVKLQKVETLCNEARGGFGSTGN